MRPTLFPFVVGGHEVSLHTYGLAIALGSALAIAVAVRWGRRLAVPSKDILDLAFWLLASGVLGARLLFVFINAGDYGRLCLGDGGARTIGAIVRDCAAPLRIWEGGLVFYGGVAAAIAAACWFARRRHLSVWVLGDLFAPGLALGHAVGRLGCFAAGCCFGKECAPAWYAVRFPRESQAFQDLAYFGLVDPTAWQTPPLHPTQLYESAGELLVFFALLLWGDDSALPERWHSPTPGCTPSCARWWRIFRGDATRRYLFPFTTPHLAGALGLPASEPLFLSTGQAVSLLVVMGIAVILRRRAGASATD